MMLDRRHFRIAPSVPRSYTEVDSSPEHRAESSQLAVTGPVGLHGVGPVTFQPDQDSHQGFPAEPTTLHVLSRRLTRFRDCPSITSRPYQERSGMPSSSMARPCVSFASLGSLVADGQRDAFGSKMQKDKAPFWASLTDNLPGVGLKRWGFGGVVPPKRREIRFHLRHQPT